MSIFKEHALKYLQKGYSVIPDKAGSKIPAITGWNAYSEKMPEIDDVRQWSIIKDANLSIMFGKLSGVVGLDLDTNDPEILKQINHLLPASPIERKGSKGFVRFYRFNGEVSQEVFENYIDPVDNVPKKRVILELLSTGKKATIPPSIHPSGKPYIWIGPDLLDIEKESLPTLPYNLLNVIAEKLKLQQNSYIDSYKISAGRNSALGTFCAELIMHQDNVESAINQLVEFDKKTNTVPLFGDSGEFKTKLPIINAGKFYFNYLESINIKREKNGLLPELPSQILSLIQQKDTMEASVKTTLPKPTGLLKTMVDYIISKSYVEQPALALSSALATLGTLTSRKIVFQNVTPNLYILNIAESGSGKDSVQQAAKTLLKAAKMPQLIGASQYPSEASIIAFLSQQPVRLDIIDEASSFLKSASSGGAPYQTGIGDTLCELYTSANEQYLGKVLAADGGKRVGQCYRPHVNILCSTTFRGVSEGISHSTLEKGLFARFLTFFGEEGVPAKRIRNSIPVPTELEAELIYWGSWTNPKATGNILENQPPLEIGIDKDADELLDKYFYQLDDLKCNSTRDTVSKPIVARLYQQMLKVILISAISNNSKAQLVPKVSLQDVQFGYELIMYFYSQINEFIETTLHDNDRSKNVNKILYLIKKSGKEGVSNIELVKQSKSIRPNERLEIIKDLYESQLITKKESIKESIIIHTFFYIGA